MFGYQAKHMMMSMYDRFKHCLSVSVNRYVFSLFYMKVTESPKRELGAPT